MKLISFARIGIISTILIIYGTSQSYGSKYADELAEAGQQLQSVLVKNEYTSDLRSNVFEYISHSKNGMTFFLYVIQIMHEMLNQPEVKEVLQFLTDNDIDIMKLFSVNVPPNVVDKMKKMEEGEDDSGSADTAARPPLPNISDLIDLDAFISIAIELLEENTAVQKIFDMLSETSLQLEVYAIIQKYKDTDNFKKVFQSRDAPIKLPTQQIIKGLTKMFTSRKGNVDRFVDGMELMLNCKENAKNSGCAGIAKYRKLEKKVEL
ncbi:uncharacterized protein LOC110863008 [Folsomia candida]|nr:uncharacterized protein LOC110863008 [Folsomia candida]